MRREARGGDALAATGRRMVRDHDALMLSPARWFGRDGMHRT